MASHATGLRRFTPAPVGVSKLWTDNSEPTLVDMLDDSVVKAVMACDGITRRDILKLVGRFHPTLSDWSVAESLEPFCDRSGYDPSVNTNVFPSVSTRDGSSYERTKEQARASV